MHDNNEIKDEIENDDKWDFADYAYTITGIIVGVLLVGPELMESFFNISFLGGSLGNVASGLVEGLEDGRIMWTLAELRAFSPMLFLLTTTIVFFQEAYVARKTGGYTGSLFTHTFESLFEEAIYMAITTVMVYGAVLFGAMYASWLAGPITWILFVFIFPFVKKKAPGDSEIDLPWILLLIFAVGIVAEVITQAWIAFPLAWLVICAVKLVDTIREYDRSPDEFFNILYYVFSVVLMAVGLMLNYWIVSWAAFPIALFICWVLSKFGMFRKVEAGK